MREIKCRVRVKSTNEISNIARIDFISKEVFVLKEFDGHLEEFIYSFDEVDFIESTGLNDKNGKEIYEGDIVEFKTMSKRVERHYVEYSEYGEWCVGMHRLPMRFQACEVVGNIYENPELLGDSQ